MDQISPTNTVAQRPTWKNSEGYTTRRPARRAANEDRTRHQSQNGESAQPRNSADAARPRRRGDRMTRREFMSGSERVPGRGRREFEIADIRVQPYPHPR